MEISQLIQSGNYINEFKKHKVIFRKYPKLGLLIAKQKYGATYSEDIPWLNYCRGLVINYEKDEIVFLPPVKAREIQTYEEFSKLGDYRELIDGTMINLFYTDRWMMATRSNIGCNNQWSAKLSFKQMFKECSLNFDYEALDKTCTYSFVMRHRSNRITTPIETNQLYLVEMRRGLEVIEPVKSEFYNVVSSSDISHSLYKGLTCYQGGIRYKWLTNEHKFIEMIKPNTNNPHLDYLQLRSSGHLINYLKMFPEKRFEFDKYRNQLHNFTQALYDYYRGVFVQKEINKKDIPFSLKPFIYVLHKEYLTTQQSISYGRVKQYIYEQEPKKLLFALNRLE